jgi:hypothetical protein
MSATELKDRGGKSEELLALTSVDRERLVMGMPAHKLAATCLELADKLDEEQKRSDGYGAACAESEAQLAERTRERDEAKAALDAETYANELANKAMAQGVANVIAQLIKERDEARAESALLRKKLLLHPSGCCTCHGEGEGAWCQITALSEESERLREALEWYADAKQWSGHYGNTDNGRRARQALAKEGDG